MVDTAIIERTYSKMGKSKKEIFERGKVDKSIEL
jgi:hypothetical protein